MTTFAELTKQMHLVKDLILSDMICGVGDKTKDEASDFSKHLLATKAWFVRISYANKKRFLLALLEDVRSAWTLSCLLKSIWNCRPKDAVHSAYEKPPWSSYDQVPMDHNRTALPVNILAQVMKSDRMWFLSLEPQPQAMVLLELLSLSGGPVMWAVLKRAQMIYEKYQTEQIQNLQECTVVMNDRATPHQEKEMQNVAEKGKKDPSKSSHNDALDPRLTTAPGQAQRELEANLAQWNSTMKAMRDSLKLEELEMTFVDGSKRNIWKVNRPKPESIETECYIQLLPSEVAKRIISYLPRANLADYARVNRYWAYLIDEYRTELTTHQRLTADFEKMQDMMLRHNTSIDVLTQSNQVRITSVTCGLPSTVQSSKLPQAPSLKASERSAGAYSFRHLINPENLSKPLMIFKPLKNLSELTERLQQRGAADENIWQWCENILNNHKYRKAKRLVEGVLPHDNNQFPSPELVETLDVPLYPPLCKDPALYKKPNDIKSKKNISNATLLASPRITEKRFSLWSKDFSGLYPVCKIPSHASPI